MANSPGDQRVSSAGYTIATNPRGLPDQLLEKIVDCFLIEPEKDASRGNRRTLLALCLTSSKFYHIAGQVLYRTFDSFHYNDSPLLLLRTIMNKPAARLTFRRFGTDHKERSNDRTLLFNFDSLDRNGRVVRLFLAPDNSGGEDPSTAGLRMKLLRYVQCGLPHDLSDFERRERRRIRQDAQTAELISLCSAIDSLDMRVALDFDYGECWSLVCCLALEEQLNQLRTVRILGDRPFQSYVQHPRSISVLGPQHRGHLINLGALFNFPSIENLQIGGPKRSDQLCKSLFNAVMFDSPNYSNVTSLALCQIELTRDDFANDILPTCSSLKHLTYYFDARLLTARDGPRLELRYNELSGALARCNPHLATLVWEAFDRNEDEDVFDGCRDMTSLVDMTLPWWALAKERGRNVLGRNYPPGRLREADNSPFWRTVHVPSILPACLQTLRLMEVPFHGYIKAKTRQLYVNVVCALAQEPRMSELREIRLEDWYRSRPSMDYPEHSDQPRPLERDIVELARKGWKVSEVAGVRGGALDVLLERVLPDTQPKSPGKGGVAQDDS